ncbi:MAG: hypothetical protein V3S19_00010 [Gemmatimonadales bacterium]
MPVQPRPLGAFVAAILMVTMTVAAAAATPPPTPSFPATIDNYAKNAPWVCDPTVKPGTKAFADLLKSTYGYGYSGLTRSCGATSGAGRSYHKMGLAFDWSVTVYDAANRNTGNEVIAWLLATDEHGNKHALARRLGVVTIIWNDKVWRASTREWRDFDALRSCGSTSEGCRHRNHMHFTLSADGAYQRTSWWNAGTGVEWETGTPSWAKPDTERAVTIGLLEPFVAGNDTLQRHEVAVIFDRLGLLYGQPQPGSGEWTTGTPTASKEAMGRMVSVGYWSPTWAGSDDVQRYEMAAILDRAGFLAGQPVAASGTWETGTPSWAHTVMGRAVSAGLFSKDWQGNDSLQRYELAVVLGRLHLLASWREGTPAWAVSSMTNAVDHGLLSDHVPGSDVLERDETAVLLDRLGLLTASATAPSGNWENGTRDWAGHSMSKAVKQGIWSSNVRGSDTVTRAELAVVLDRLGFFAGRPVAAGGTWETGTPSWAHAALGRAVSAGVLSKNVRGDDLVNRYEFAVVVDDRLGLLIDSD